MTPRDKIYGIRLSEDERKKLDEAVKKAGFQDRAEYIRYMTIGEGSEINEKLDDVSKDTKEILKKLK